MRSQFIDDFFRLDIGNDGALLQMRADLRPPGPERALGHDESPFGQTQRNDATIHDKALGAQDPRVCSTASTIFAAFGMYRASNTGAKGTGVCGGVTTRT